MAMTYLSIPPYGLVGSSSALVTQIPTANTSRISVNFTVSTAALTNFTIKGFETPTVAAAQAMTLYSTSADFVAPKGLLVGCSGDLTVQGVGTGWFIMETTGLYRVELWATSGGTARITSIEVGVI